MRRPNGTATTYGYDASRLISLAHDVPNNAYDLTLTEGYNPAFQIVTETRSNDAFSFTANANTNIAYVANGLNQGKQADATVYTFDANGNTISDGWFTFTYDLENKLVSALPINAGVRTLNYDPLNRLDTYNPGTAKRFIYDGAEVAAELDSSGNIIGRYVRGDAPDEIITGYTSANPTARGWYHLDQRNSVIAVTDPNGVVTVVNRYDEYGQPQGGNYGTFQYTGQMWLGEIGVYNYKNRMYWPNERPGGRFLQADPTGYGPGMNRYVYVNGNPVNAVDPSGTEGRAFSGIDTDDRSPTRDFTPRGAGWGSHSWDWGGQAAWSALDQQELLARLNSMASRAGVDVHCLFSCSIEQLHAAAAHYQATLNAVASSGLFWAAGANSGGISAGHNFIYTNPSFFTHVADRHYGLDTSFDSQFDQRFQNSSSTFLLAEFAANNGVMRPGRWPGSFTYTARYSRSVGYLYGTGAPTNYITLAVSRLGYLAANGLPAYDANSLYPGWPR